MRTILLLLSLSLAHPVVALAHPITSTASAAYRRVERERAMQQVTDLELEAGRSTVIDFSQTNSRIVFVNLADPSRAVWTSNVPMASGQATTLFITPIEPLRFSGAMTNAVTNLMVQTLDDTGVKSLYTFNLHHVQAAREVGVLIVPQSPVAPANMIDEFTLGSMDAGAIERGLRIAIARGYTAFDDPVVEQTRQAIASLQRGQIPRQVPVSVLRSLQALGRYQ
ncbi:MAG: hypothetical protein F6K32_22535 [Desertifilum sp. SIO1I2]|nr:hypothetical protein [Desertifilum sp. SIO1I2]